MKAKPLQRESPSSEAAVERRASPRVAVARRIDSKRPTRVWSLLPPPTFPNNGPKKEVS